MKKRQIIILSVLAAVFVLLLTAVLVMHFAFDVFNTESNTATEPPKTLEEGEAYYQIGSSQVSSVVLMYPQLNRSDICQIRVHNDEGNNYFFFHTLSGNLNYFALGQCDSEDWEWDADDLYYPDILNSYVGEFDYTSLYDDTSTLPTMLAAVGTVMIDERIKPEDGVLTQEFLSRYGLARADSPSYFEIVVYLRDNRGNYIYTPLEEVDALVGYEPDENKYYYLNSNGGRGEEYTAGVGTLTPTVDTENTRRVYVGNRTVDDTGYYLYLEGRNTVYTTQTSYLNDVVGRDLGYYVAPRLVTQSESVYANQLPPCFSLHNGKFSIAETTIITPTMTIGFTADRVIITDSENIGSSGSTVTEYRQFKTVDLSDATLNAIYKAVLTGKHVGESVDILLPSENLSEIGKTEHYSIRRVMGIMTDGGYVTTSGRAVAENDRILVAYTDGRTVYDGGLDVVTGYIDLSDAQIPADLKSQLVGLQVGDDCSITYDALYTGTETSLYYVTVALEEIESATATDGSTLSAVAYGSTVRMTYMLYEGGEVVGQFSRTLTIPPEEDFEDDAKWIENGYGDNQIYLMRNLFRELLGLAVGSYVDNEGKSNKEIQVAFPTEYISDFTMYQGAVIEFSTDYEEQLTFSYTNEKDIYFGSSLYRIQSPSDRVLYGLDSNATLAVLRMFEDMVGDETVALGLDAEAMRKYGLYAYKLYYEMPFNCYTIDDGDKTSYYYKNSIGFNLYISEKQEDGSRYIGSDMYDIVVKVTDGASFDFVEKDFETYWVQNNLLLVSYENLRGMIFDLNYAEDAYNHVWGFDIAVDPSYPYATEYYENGVLKTEYDYLPRLYAMLVDGGAHTGKLTYEQLRAIFEYVRTTDTTDYSKLPYEAQTHIGAGRYIETVSDVLRYITELKEGTGTDIDALYNYVKTLHKDQYDGTYNLMRLLQMINSTCYWGTAAEDLTDEEIEQLMTDEDACTMTLALTLCDENSRLYGYTLRFYNYSGHSLVSISDERNDNETHLFYIQAREVNRIAAAVIALTNGQPVNVDQY